MLAARTPALTAEPNIRRSPLHIQTRTRSAEVVWGAGHSAFRTSVLHHTQDDFWAEPMRRDSASFVYRPKFIARKIPLVVDDVRASRSRVPQLKRPAGAIPPRSAGVPTSCGNGASRPNRR